MNAEDMVEATAVPNVVKTAVEEDAATIERSLRNIDDTNILKGGKPAENVIDCYNNIRNLIKKVQSYTAKISEFTDRLAVDINELTTQSNIGASAASAAADATKAAKMTR